MVIAALLGSVASVAVFWLALSWEYRAAETEFQNKARNFQQAIDGELESASTLLSTLRAFFEATDGVNRLEFERFSKELHDRVTGLRDTAWLPRVTRDERADFEQKARASGAPDFEIRQPDSLGRPRRAGDSAVFYPILFHDSGHTQYRVQGFDLASEPVRRRAIERAIKTDGPAATPPITLLTVKRPNGGVMAFVPVDARGEPETNGTARPPRGVVMGIVDIDVMMENILADRARLAGIDVVLFDPAATPDKRLIYWRSALPTPSSAPSEQSMLAGTHRQGVVSLFDQRWTVVFAPSQKLEALAWNWHALMPLVVGLTMTGMVVAYLLVSMRRTAKLEQLTRELRLNARTISHMARHDSLTGLPNRALFNERMSQAVDRLHRGTPFVVLYLDLDHFKAVNDSLGHGSGDRLLLDVAGRLKTCVRAVDTVARLGGDEFAILLAETASAVLVEQIATRLIAAVGSGYEIGGHAATVGLSIGIAMAPGDGVSAEVLLARADRALYAAKSGGRGGYRFHDQGFRAGARQRPPVESDVVHGHAASA